MSPAEKIILLSLARLADPDGRCWPTAKQLAEGIEISRSAISRHLRTLEYCGLIYRNERTRLFFVLADATSFAAARAAGYQPEHRKLEVLS